MNNILLINNFKTRCISKANYLTLFLMFMVITMGSFQLSAASAAPSKLITLNVKDVTIKELLKQLKQNSEYSFWYSDTEVNDQEKVSVNVKDQTVEVILNQVLSKQKLSFEIKGNVITIFKQKPNTLVNGTVTNVNMEALIGATVLIEGTASGTITDSEGNFKINAPQNSVLVVSYTGMTSERIRITNQSKLNIKLEDSSVSLNEMVVIGYGSAKKRDIVGSVSTVDTKNLQLKGSATFDGNLQGLAAGVSVQSESGVPGAPTRINIRGISSISSGTSPLWIVDGMPILSYDVAQNNGSTNQSPMSLINQNDIESIQVLKDAAATAIYGSRASNGVIIITTKSGKKGKTEVSFDVSTGVSDLSRKPSDIGYANTNQWFSVMDDMYKNSGKTFDMTEYYKAMPYAFDKLTRAQAEAVNTNWYDQLFQKGSFQDVNFSTSKNSDKSNSYFSLNYRRDDGVQRFNSLERYTGRTNLDFNPVDNLSLGGKFSFSYSTNNRMQNSAYRGGEGSNGGLNAITTSAMPWYPIYSPIDNSKYYNPYGGSNPMAYADPKNIKDELEQFRAMGGVYADYKLPFIKGLSLRSEFSFDLLQSNSTFWKSKDVNLDSGKKPNSYASDQAVTYKSINYNAYATYDKTIGDHYLNAVIGTEAQRIYQSNHEAAGQNLVGIFQELGTPGDRISMFGGITGERYLLSYFGRANYKFKDKYLLGLSIRRDGSSAFLPENRWGTFKAFSAGWILSEEAFMDFMDEKTFLKLRGSYGEVGNQSIPGGLDRINYEGSYMMYGGPGVSGENGTLPTTIAVGNLTWEKSKSTDFGFDFGFNDNRINGSVAYYSRYVSDMLLKGPIPVSAGVGGHPYVDNNNVIWGNLGDMVNSGIEIELHSTNIQAKDFKWSTDFNIAFNKNAIKKLTSLADDTGKGLISETQVSRKGHKRYEWFMADYAGVDKTNGVPMIYALDQETYDKTGETVRLKDHTGKDSLIYATDTNIPANRFYQDGKSADPTYFGGLTNTFSYKGFDLSFLLSFSGGNYIYDYDEQLSTVPSTTRNFKTDIIGNTWTKPGDDAKYPRLTADNTYEIDGKSVNGFGTEWKYYNRTLYKGDYIRLKNIQVGYNFPKNITNALKLSALRLNLSGTNLWTNTQYPGFDPEGAGFVYTATIPQLKSIILGLNVKL